MPAATIAIAKDEIYARLQAAIDNFDDSISVIYPDSRKDVPRDDDAAPDTPPAGTTWIEATITHIDGRPRSLGRLSGGRVHKMQGVLTAVIYTPAGDGSSRADALAQVVLDAYRSGGQTPSGVQFKTATPKEAGKSGSWFQVICLVEFEYFQLRP